MPEPRTSANRIQMIAQQLAGMPSSELIKWLQEGNDRYVKGRLKDKGCGDESHRKKIGSGQAPPVAILGCADSRVPPELIFDMDAGELFTCRVAGNVANADSMASFEYACKHLGTKLIVVLGHTKCGAVGAACGDQSQLDGNLPGLMHKIRPHCLHSRRPVHDNVRAQVENLNTNVANYGKDSGIEVVGAVFDLETGKVEWL